MSREKGVRGQNIRIVIFLNCLYNPGTLVGSQHCVRVSSCNLGKCVRVSDKSQIIVPQHARRPPPHGDRQEVMAKRRAAQRKSIRLIVRKLQVKVLKTPPSSVTMSAKLAMFSRWTDGAHPFIHHLKTSQSTASVNSCAWKKADSTFLCVLHCPVTPHEQQLRESLLAGCGGSMS